MQNLLIENEIAENFGFDITAFITTIVLIAVVVMFAFLAIKILSKATERTITHARNDKNEARSKTSITIATLLNSLGRTAIYFIAICIVLNQLGYGSVLSNIVTAAGVGALVISMGAQNVIGDLISGVFIIFEGQFSVDDFVKINDYTGTVKSLTARCTTIQIWTGENVIIPNGQIKTVINYSGIYNVATVDVPVPYDADPDYIKEVLLDIATNYYEKHQDICYDKPDVLGINDYNERGMIFSVNIKAVKTNHFRIHRDLRIAIKKGLEEVGVQIPYNQLYSNKLDK